MKSLFKRVIRRLGYEVTRVGAASTAEFPPDFTEQEIDIISKVRPYTMTRTERIVSLIRSVEYIVEANIPGDMVECGVWRGGSTMTVALTLLSLGDTSRRLYLYDTYEGMTDPSDLDRYYDNRAAEAILKATQKNTGMWCYASLDEVRNNMLSTGYPEERIIFVKGKVEDTIPDARIGTLALLRLDTDWYESTKHTLSHLFPLVNPGGIIILDDYGCWQGARLAVDEYFKQINVRPFLHRIDYSGRLIVKPFKTKWMEC